MNKEMDNFNIDKNDELRKISGYVTSDSRLVAFLYQLMRDELPAGIVEKLIREVEYNASTLYTNGYLAEYAKNLAERLSND